MNFIKVRVRDIMWQTLRCLFWVVVAYADAVIYKIRKRIRGY